MYGVTKGKGRKYQIMHTPNIFQNDMTQIKDKLELVATGLHFGTEEYVVLSTGIFKCLR